MNACADAVNADVDVEATDAWGECAGGPVDVDVDVMLLVLVLMLVFVAARASLGAAFGVGGAGRASGGEMAARHDIS